MAITDLKQLLSDLKPELVSDDYVFCSLKIISASVLPESFHPIATFREKEGLSVICLQDEAERHGFEYDGVMNLITLNVYSSLEAVGMTAAISKVLTDADISANIVAAFHHDHVFVPKAKAIQALKLLQAMAESL